MELRSLPLAVFAAIFLYTTSAAGLLSGNTGVCTRSDSIVYLTWIQKHKPSGVKGTWVDPFATEAWWNSNNGNGRRKRGLTPALTEREPRTDLHSFSKRQLDCSDSDSPGVCLRDSGRMLCYSQSSGMGVYEDGYEIDFVSGDYTTPDGKKGNIQYGPCPGDVYDKEEDGRRCTRNPTVKTSSTTTSSSASRTSAPDSTGTGSAASASTSTDDSGAGALVRPDKMIMVLAVGGLLWLL